MKKIHRPLARAILLGLSAPLFAGEAKDLRLVVRVFMVPPTQQFDSVLPDGPGGTTSLQVCGNVTSSFPRATVFFPTELAAPPIIEHVRPGLPHSVP